MELCVRVSVRDDEVVVIGGNTYLNFEVITNYDNNWKRRVKANKELID